MGSHVSRRRFLKSISCFSAAIALPAIAPRSILGASERLNIAGIGVGGKGESDIGLCDGENVVALCDVDDRMAAASIKKFPMAARYKDYRRMLDVEGRSIDAVTVSTPDHMHAPASILAMRMGKHVHCQKPLTHSVFEARRMAEVAREFKVATQMGNQGSAHWRTRRMAELLRGGAIGPVREIHIWTDRPIWPQGPDAVLAHQGVQQALRGTPAGDGGFGAKTPGEMDWDLWLGPAPARAYDPCYAPFKWRGWRDFGTGALGDMGCHSISMVFFALRLEAPESVEAQSAGLNDQTYPAWSTVVYQFAARGDRPPVKLFWYDGGRKPPAELIREKTLPDNGAIYVGEKDTMGAFRDAAGSTRFLSRARLESFQDIPETLPRTGARSERDIDLAHRREWIAACKGGPRAFSNFDHAGPLTETVLLGNVALAAGRKIEWDAGSLRIPNFPEAEKFLRCEHRKGFEI